MNTRHYFWITMMALACLALAMLALCIAAFNSRFMLMPLIPRQTTQSAPRVLSTPIKTADRSSIARGAATFRGAIPAIWPLAPAQTCRAVPSTCGVGNFWSTAPFPPDESDTAERSAEAAALQRISNFALTRESPVSPGGRGFLAPRTAGFTSSSRARSNAPAFPIANRSEHASCAAAANGSNPLSSRET